MNPLWWLLALSGCDVAAPAPPASAARFPAETDLTAADAVVVASRAGIAFVVDVDGDGSSDVVTTSDDWSDGNLYAASSPTSGTVASTVAVARDKGTGWTSEAVADVDGDGHDDLLYRCGATEDDPDLCWWPGARPGWSPSSDDARLVRGLGWVVRVATGHFAGDGATDVLAGDPDEGPAATRGGVVLLFEGPVTAGTPAGAASVAVVGRVDEAQVGQRIALGDLDGDGRDDIATTTADHRLLVYTTLGRGTYGEGDADHELWLMGDATDLWARHDLDGDGRNDLVAPIGYWSGTRSMTFLFTSLGDGDADELATTKIRTTTDVQGSRVDDLDGDGAPDVAFAGSRDPDETGAAAGYYDAAYGVSVVYGPFPAGTLFDADAWISVSSQYANPPRLAGGDVDGDGVGDLLVWAEGKDDVNVFLGR